MSNSLIRCYSKWFLAACLVLAGGTSAFASASVEAALKKCQSFDKMSDAQLEKIAVANHLTAKRIRGECYELENRKELANDPSYIAGVCRKFLGMSPSGLAELARENHTTPGQIRRACYVIRHPESGGSSSSGSSSSSSSSTEDPNTCSCGSTQVCVHSGGGYICRDPSSSDNTCSYSGDCLQNPIRGISNCIDGRCT